MAGDLRVGTSGFAYRSWSPAFYPPSVRADAMLRFYAEHFPTCELNNTYYQHPKVERIAAWLAETPDSFRFAVKAHRTGSMRAFATDPAGTLPWITDRFRPFSDRLGAVLWRVPSAYPRDDAMLARFLAEWPRDLPIAMEFEDATWSDAAVERALDDAGAALCLTDRDDGPAPALTPVGPFSYLRLRRSDYGETGLAAWADALTRVVESGRDAYVFFRHDEIGRAAERAARLTALAEERRAG